MKKKASELRPGDRVVLTIRKAYVFTDSMGIEFEEDLSEDKGISINRMVEVLPPGYDDVGMENRCDACDGTGHPISGLPCMCRGTGKMSEAAVTLRETLVETEAGRDALKALLADAVEFVTMAGDATSNRRYTSECQCCGSGQRIRNDLIHMPSCRLNVWLSKVKP